MNDEFEKWVQVGEGAKMAIPVNLEWHLRYGDPKQVRFIAAEVIMSFDYLLQHCTFKEATRRLRLLRKARKGK